MSGKYDQNDFISRYLNFGRTIHSINIPPKQIRDQFMLNEMNRGGGTGIADNLED